MTKAELQAFAQAQVDLLKPKAMDTQKSSGQRAKGKLLFYEALLAVYTNTQTPEQFGLLDAVNDTFQEIGAFASDTTFFTKPEECCRPQ